MDIRDEILTFLKARKEQIFSEFGLVKIGLFGSIARNEYTDESDIDVIVEFAANTQDLFAKKSQLRAIFQKEFNRNADICREKYLKPYIRKDIIESAIYV